MLITVTATYAWLCRCRTVDELSRFVAYLIGAQHLLDSAPFTDIPKHIWGLLYSPLSTGTDLVARCETAIARMVWLFPLTWHH